MKVLSVISVLIAVVVAETAQWSGEIGGRDVNASAVYTGPATIKGDTFSGDVNGKGAATIEGFGTVNVVGAAKGNVQTDLQGKVYVNGAIDGSATGPNGAFARGAATGEAMYNQGTASATGMINGEASAEGYSARGAAMGSVKGTVSNNGVVNVNSAQGVADGCYTEPNGKQACGAASNNPGAVNYNYPWTVPGTYGQQNAVGGGSGMNNNNNNNKTGQNGQVYGKSTPNGADTLVATGSLASIAGIAALMLL